MTDLYLFAFVNFVLSVALCAVVGCRLNSLPENPPVRTQVLYAICMLAGVVSASQPWIGLWPRWASVITTGALLAYAVFASPLPRNRTV